MSIIKQPTGVDVARLAGVSKSAVSRAFTGGSVSEDSRRKIFDAARRLRYRPSQAARSLKTSRSRLIGLAVTHLDNQFYPEVIECVSETIASLGSRIVLFITHGEAELEPMIDELLGFSLDGVILASGSYAIDVAMECRAASMPVIMFNNIDEGGRIPGVGSDNAMGGTAIANHFIEQGHRRTAVMIGVEESSTSHERANAFSRTMLRAGLPEPVIIHGHYTAEGAARAMGSLLDREDAPSAVFCVNDHMALSAIETCRAHGREPGRDIAIAGFDNVAISAWPSFALTSYSQSIGEMVDACVARLFAEIDGVPCDRETMRIPGELIVRGSSNFKHQE